MTGPLVSVIIPTYNRAASVVDAIASVQAQTYRSTQLIVVDDGSSDDTTARVSGLPGVEYHKQPHSGQGAARNLGLTHARGSLIASLDSDDVWDPDFLATSVAMLEESQLDLVFSNWVKLRDGERLPSEWLVHRKWTDYQTTARGEWWMLSAPQLRRLFLDICPAPSSSLVVKRSVIGTGWGHQMLIADDWYLLLDIVLSRPCRAAFTLTPRWTKRVDGQNVYDGQPPVETLRKLYLHDSRIFRRAFADRLTRRERLAMATREFKYAAYLAGRQAARSRLAQRSGLHAVASLYRPLSRWLAE